MSKSGCTYTLESLSSACGQTFSKGLVRGYLIPYEAASITWGTTATTYNVVTALTLTSGAKAIEITDLRTARFDGTQKANSDGVYEGQFTKTFSWNYKNIGITASQDVDALVNHADGWLLIVERDKSHGSSAFEIFGAQSPCKVTSVSANYGTEDDLQNTPTLTIECTEGQFGTYLNVSSASTSEDESYTANATYVANLMK